MDYNDVSLFVQVVLTGSFTAVATKLGVQKSSVSRSVARLEEDLGVRLLQRTTRSLAPTEAGQAFFDRVRGAVADVDEAANAAKEGGSEPRGIVRLTAPPDSDSFGLPDAIARFVEQYPKIHVELTLVARTVDLVAEGVDLAVRAGKLGDSSLVARKVGMTGFCFVRGAQLSSPSGDDRRRSRICREHECVLFRAHGGRATWTLSGPNGPETIEVTGRVSADEMAFVGKAAAAGAGIALIPVSFARDLVRRQTLEQVLPEFASDGAGLHVVLPSSVFVPSRVALLRDFLVEYLSRELAEAQKQCASHNAARNASRPAVVAGAKRRVARA